MLTRAAGGSLRLRRAQLRARARQRGRPRPDAGGAQVALKGCSGAEEARIVVNVRHTIDRGGEGLLRAAGVEGDKLDLSGKLGGDPATTSYGVVLRKKLVATLAAIGPACNANVAASVLGIFVGVVPALRHALFDESGALFVRQDCASIIAAALEALEATPPSELLRHMARRRLERTSARARRACCARKLTRRS